MTRSDRKRLLQSGFASAGIWLVLAILAIVVPLNKPENAKRLPVVHIALAAVPAVPSRDRPKVSAPERDSVPRGDRTPAQPSKAKTQPASRSTAGKQDSSGGLGIPNFSKPLSSSGRQASSGAELEFSSDASAPLGSPSKSSTQEFEGTAANVDARTESGLTGKSSGRQTRSGSASDDTSRSLDAVVAGAASRVGTDENRPSGGASGSAADSASESSASAISGLAFDGASRKLLYPASPAIVLPDRLSRLVNSDRSVTVRFTVRADGSVPAALVEFTPQAALPPEIRDWLRKEFSGWRFEKSGTDGQAQFLYSIRVQ